MKSYLLTFLLSIAFTISFYAVAIFFPRLEFYLIPIAFGMFLIGLLGFVVMPIGLFKLIKHKAINPGLKLIISLALGYYVGLMLHFPLSNWDENNRNLSGQILSSELEKFKLSNGSYPDSLEQLSLKELEQKMPSTYKPDRFGYYIQKDDYMLYIPIPIFDRWLWDKEENKFVYNDF